MTKKLLGDLELNRIYQRDCIEGMRMLPDDSVDLIVIDPPYNIGKDKRWDKWRSVEEYVAWMTEVFRECERVLKPNGSFYWFHNDFEQIVELHRALCENTSFVFKQFIVWNKRFEGAKLKGYLDAHIAVDGLRNYKQMAEYCLFYTFQDETGLEKILPLAFKPYLDYMAEQKERMGWKAKDFNEYLGYKSIASHWFWQDKERTKQPQPRFIAEKDYLKLQETGYFKKPYEELRKEYEKQRYVFNNQKTHHSVWNYEVAPKISHSTPKPVELIENIIRHSSNEGAIVLDCFMGSGTTAVAASRLNRNFIGFEREPEYVRIANQRLENVSDEKLTDGKER